MATDPVLHALGESGLLKRGDRVLCALSGGADSVCLTHGLCALREELGLTVAAAHFSHGLRPEAGEEEKLLCTRLCDSLGIPLFCGEGDTRALARKQGLSVEEAARRLRYRFLEETARAWSADWVATGHNLEDNAETVLINLIRGTGRAGLEGIPPRRDRLIRPLLTVSREEIERYDRENGLSFAIDPTNLGEDNTRALLRSRVFPLLRQINPRASEHISAAARGLREEGGEVDLAARELASLAERTPEGILLPIGALTALPGETAARAMQLIQREIGGKMLSRRQVEALLALCAGDDPSAECHLTGSRAVRRYEKLLFTAGRRPDPPETVTLSSPGSADFGEWTVTVGEGAFPVTIRSRREGDTLPVPAGHKTLKKWMIEKKIPREERGSVPVVCRENEILAVGDLWPEKRREGLRRVICRRKKP